MSIPQTDAIQILELAEELAKAERDLAYAESAFDRLGRRDRQRDVDEARAALVSALGISAAPNRTARNSAKDADGVKESGNG